MTMIHIAVGLLFEEGSPKILEATFYEDERGPLHLSMDPARFSQLKSYEEVQHEIRLVLGVEKTALRRGGLNLHKEFRRLEESGWHAFAHLRSIALLSDIEQPHSTLHIFEWVRYDLYPHAMHRGIRLIPSWKGICKPEAWKFLYGEVFSGVQEREVTAAPFQPLRLLPKGEIPDFSGTLEAFAVDFDIKIVRPQKPMPFFLTPGVEIVRYLGKESSIEIPARIAGEPVRISDFAAPSTLREVRIAEGVEVFDFAFWKCENLYDENGFQILGDRLLSYRGAAETVRVPDGVREIGPMPFPTGAKRSARRSASSSPRACGRWNDLLSRIARRCAASPCPSPWNGLATAPFTTVKTSSKRTFQAEHESTTKPSRDAASSWMPMALRCSTARSSSLTRRGMPCARRARPTTSPSPSRSRTSGAGSPRRPWGH